MAAPQGKMACPDCLNEFSYPAARGGQAVNCPSCNSPLRLPIVPGSMSAVTGSKLAKKAAEEEEDRKSRFEDTGPEVYAPASFTLFFGVVALLLAGGFLMKPGPQLCIGLAVLAALSGLVGVGLGILSLINIYLNKGTYSGLGLAIPGFLLSIVFGGIVPINPVSNAMGELGLQSKMKQAAEQMGFVAAAHLLFDDRMARMPSDILDAEGKPLLSWRVTILPDLGESELYEKFKLDEPWDSPHNLSLVSQMPKALSCTIASMQAGHTLCMHPVGKNAIYSPNSRRVFSRDVKSGDGLAVTLVLAEVKTENSCVWTQPADWQFDPENPRDGLAPEPLVGFANGLVVRMPSTVSTADLKAYLTVNGGEGVRALQKQ